MKYLSVWADVLEHVRCLSGHEYRLNCVIVLENIVDETWRSWFVCRLDVVFQSYSHFLGEHIKNYLVFLRSCSHFLSDHLLAISLSWCIFIIILLLLVSFIDLDHGVIFLLNNKTFIHLLLFGRLDPDHSSQKILQFFFIPLLLL